MKFVEGLSSVNTPQSAKSGYKTLLVCGGIPMKSLVKVLKNGMVYISYSSLCNELNTLKDN